ncbi:hypothetical protein TRIATDRAFT_298180 [Trichoderma atroviride IMI 206040]|uniref:Uncharacterized protein n=1 Tax=Hypocrea atroviridis (strain ATCC 20476 / IMI 206040) TaxID=452589 RepID=G9NLZ2_HYPAI|nr:uncharacterized protein TRIATDRAFT_298180 [Trichoderma atroviride IMI 206040]EHK47926.1 hypothetical protein TRIATDRAFT_298180 [Trichoderma atroviride IMI 206040]
MRSDHGLLLWHWQDQETSAEIRQWSRNQTHLSLVSMSQTGLFPSIIIFFPGLLRTLGRQRQWPLTPMCLAFIAAPSSAHVRAAMARHHSWEPGRFSLASKSTK